MTPASASTAPAPIKTRRPETETVPSNSPHTISLTLYGCATGGGTVTATLSRDGSTVDTATQTVSVVPPGISIKISDLSPKIAMWGFFGIYKVGAWHGPFTVSASNLDSTKSYMIKLTITDKAPDRIAISFDAGCSLQEKVLTVPADSTSHTGRVELQGCDAMDGTVTAKLLEDDSEVDSATHPIKVRADVRPRFYRPDVTDITVGNTAKLRFTLDGLDSTKTYTVLFETSAAGIGFNSGCSVKSVTKLLSGKTYYSVPNEDFAGSDTLYGCTTGRGSVTAKVYRGASVSEHSHRRVSHSVNVHN